MSIKRNVMALAIGAVMLPATASASLSWTFNFSEASALLGEAMPDSAEISAVQLVAESAIYVNDNDTSGDISAGDTFLDAVAFSITGSTLTNGGPFAGNFGFSAVGSGYENSGNFQLTGVVLGLGTQQTDNFYTIDNAAMALVFDAGSDFSAADFSNLYTFIDGVVVEGGVGTGFGDNNVAGFPDGNFELFLQLSDLLASDPLGIGGTAIVTTNLEDSVSATVVDNTNNPFELINDWNGSVLGLIDANNELCEDQGGQGVCNSTIAGNNGFDELLTLAGFDLSTFDFAIHTTSDGSLSKNAIPEPAGLALLGIGLLGLGAAKRKKA